MTLVKTDLSTDCCLYAQKKSVLFWSLVNHVYSTYNPLGLSFFINDKVVNLKLNQSNNIFLSIENILVRQCLKFGYRPLWLNKKLLTLLLLLIDINNCFTMHKIFLVKIFILKTNKIPITIN